jgi:hypothetical protein
MSQIALAPARTSSQNFADRTLKVSGGFWFLIAVLGQAMFLVYIVAFYGGAVVANDLARMAKVLPIAYVPGDLLGNAALATHLFLAAVITLGGPLQLLPQVRERFPVFHRWTGRVYMLTALLISITALYLVWVRGSVGGLVQHLAVSLNALLILFCGFMALRTAMARRFALHRRWAMRLYLMASGVWFFRVGLFLWLIIHKAPVGFDPKSFQGPFLNFLTFAQTLLPLAVLELYLWAKGQNESGPKLAVAALLFVLTCGMGVGIFGAAMGLWLPRI